MLHFLPLNTMGELPCYAGDVIWSQSTAQQESWHRALAHAHHPDSAVSGAQLFTMTVQLPFRTSNLNQTAQKRLEQTSRGAFHQPRLTLSSALSLNKSLLKTVNWLHLFNLCKLTRPLCTWLSIHTIKTRITLYYVLSSHTWSTSRVSLANRQERWCGESYTEQMEVVALVWQFSPHLSLAQTMRPRSLGFLHQAECRGLRMWCHIEFGF